MPMIVLVPDVHYQLQLFRIQSLVLDIGYLVMMLRFCDQTFFGIEAIPPVFLICLGCQFKVNGCLYPVFGSDVDLHDYAVINYETEETLTRKQIMEMVK